MTISKVTTMFSTTMLVAVMSLPILPGAAAGEKQSAAHSGEAKSMQSALSDAWLAGKLETTLLFNEHVNSFDIDTDVKNGVAYLNGTVDSDIERDLANEIAKSLDGISEVENHLVVDDSSAEEKPKSDAYQARQKFKSAVENATQTAQIKSKLMLNENIDGLGINVDSNGAEVTLKGVVGSAEEKELAVKIAQNTDGVERVNDELKVESKVSKS